MTSTPTGSSSAAATSPAATPDVSCEKWLETASLGGTLGFSSKPVVQSDDPVLASVGGDDCEYDFGAAGSDKSAVVDITIAPSAIAQQDEIEASLARAPKCWLATDQVPSGERTCFATAVVDGWWYSLAVSGYVSAKAVLGSFTAINTNVDAALKTLSAPTQVSVQPQVDCPSAGSPSVPVTGERDDGDGSDQTDSEIQVAAYLLAAPTTCTVMVAGVGGAKPSTKVEWDIAVYSAGSSVYDECTHSSPAAPGSTISVPGVESAYALLAYNAGQDEVCATDGKRAAILDAPTTTDPNATVYDVWDAKSRETLGSVLGRIFALPEVPTTPLAASPSGATAPATVPRLAGGVCDQLLNPTWLAVSLGGAKFVGALTGDPTLASVGGIDCQWEMGSEEDGVTGGVDLTVAPAAIADPAEVAATLSPTACDASGCVATARTGGWWYTLSSSGYKTTSAPRASFSAITAKLVAALAAATAPPRLRVIPPFACASGNPGFGVYTVGRVIETDNAQADAAFLLAGNARCEYTIGNEQWDIDVYPSGEAPDFECDASHQPPRFTHTSISVPGATSAFAVRWHGDDANFAEACVTDGSTTVKVMRDGFDYVPTVAQAWNATAIKTLSSLLMPIFTAANK